MNESSLPPARISTQAKDLVRVYTNKDSKNNGQDVLLSAVTDAETVEELKKQQLGEWRNLFEAKNAPQTYEVGEFTVLETEGRELVQQWRVFYTKTPIDEKTPGLSVDPPGKQEQTINDVKRAAYAAETLWQTKQKSGFGQAKTYFRNFCSTLNAHQEILQCIPSQSQYTSLFCGVLQSLIKASVNHQKIATGLSRALVDISEGISICGREAGMIRNVSMQKCVATYYAKIFLFYKDAMDWFMKRWWRRLGNAFREDFYDDYQTQIASIAKLSDEIRREAGLGHIAVSRATLLTVEEIREDFRLGLEGLSRQLAEHQYQNQERAREAAEQAAERDRLRSEEIKQERCVGLWQQVGRKGLLTLQDQAQNFMLRHKKVEGEKLSDNTVPDGHSESTENNLIGGQAQGTLLTRSDVQVRSGRLEDYIVDSETLIFEDETSGLHTEDKVVLALKEWTAKPTSRLLWIAGPIPNNNISALAMVSANMVSSAIELKFPIISFFYERPSQAPGLPRTRETIGLTALIYSLTRQLIHLLPIEIDSDINLSEQRFSSLDGTLRTWPQAFQLLKDLLANAPPVLLCIIHGIDFLDDYSTEPFLKDLILELERTTREADKNRLIKVLLTTDSVPMVLFKNLQPDECVNATHPKGAQAPGRARPGRVPMERMEIARSE